MFRAAMPDALTGRLSGRCLPMRRMARRACVLFLLSCAALLLLACPQKQKSAVNYVDAESALRLAINVNEVAYNSWNKVYERFGMLHREGRISEARWAAISAIDGVIVLSEADLIEGIERAKKLLDNWRLASTRVLSAENPQEVALLRERELEARQHFSVSMDYLNSKSLKLRDSYSEAVILADAVIKEGNPLPTDHIAAIRQIIKMVDYELGRSRSGGQMVAGKQTKKDGAPVTSSIK
jgi:S1-C subfamily serine protease